MSERTLKFKLGSLDLVLSPRLTPADIEWMIQGSTRGLSEQSITDSEATEVLDRLLEMLIRCANEHSPNLTKSQIFAEMAMPLSKPMGQIATVLCQVMGFIPTDQV